VDKRVEVVLQTIDDCWNQPFSVTYLARSVNLSPVRLQHLVKRETRKNIRQHIMDRRLHCASALLENTDLSVKEICHRVGFTDVRNFYRSFRHRFLVGPAAFRAARWNERRTNR